MVFRKLNHIVSAIFHHHIRVNHHIVILRLAESLINRVPRAQVGPSKTAFLDIDIVRLLQNAIVDRQIGELREILIDKIQFLIARDPHALFVNHAKHHWQYLLQTLYQITHIGEKHTRVPVKLSTVDKHLGKLPVGFLCERLHLIQILDAGLLAQLDITVARLRSRRLHTHRNQTVAHVGKLKALHHTLLEDILLDHRLVARCHHNLSIRVDM